MTRKMWLVAAGAGVAAAGLLGAALPAVAGGVASAVAPATAGYGGQHGPAGDAADAGSVGAGGRYGQTSALGATTTAGTRAAGVDPAECTTCSAEPGSGDVADLGDLGAADLQTWVEEEKVAFDLYTAFAEQYDARVFERISMSEANHMDAVRTLLATYGLDDPTAGAEPGEFTDPELAALYETLLAQGSASLDEAYAVGRAVELDDIDLLEQAVDEVAAVDVQQVLAQQLTASQRHLNAFGG